MGKSKKLVAGGCVKKIETKHCLITNTIHAQEITKRKKLEDESGKKLGKVAFKGAFKKVEDCAKKAWNFVSQDVYFTYKSSDKSCIMWYSECLHHFKGKDCLDDNLKVTDAHTTIYKATKRDLSAAGDKFSGTFKVS